ncbi:MCE family protein [uncultured Jatrophihabitans sp.]|uniref:MCE family protein n=1 Tax=uncultured Jatrophihabitans sp. TaxID=1610747 RepID=UPI0035C9DFAD
MPREPFIKVVKRRLYGVLFIAIVVGLVSLSIAIYNKAFTSTVDVTLHADHTGNELLTDSDVKVRGEIIGSVASVDSKGGGAIVKLKLEPDKVKLVPSNVKAQILPKTLFGEQYVALILPAHSDGAIKSGDTIPQDRSKGALEAQKVLADFYPLLTAVQPAQLNATLTALADALHNRGAKLGQTLVTFDKYLKVMNPHTKQFVDDLKQLGKVSLEYNDAAPDLLATLQNLETSARTVVAKQAGFDSLLVTGSDTSNVLRGFLADNEQRIIAVSGQTSKIFSLLDEYSPEFTCLFSGINKLYSLAGNAIYNNQIHLTFTVDNNNQGAYKPGQEPRIVTGLGPNCFGLPNPGKPFQIPGKYRCFNDGAPLTSDACARNASADIDNKAINSPEENAYVNTLIAAQLHTTPNKVSGAATLLAGPLLRGQQVAIK